MNVSLRSPTTDDLITSRFGARLHEVVVGPGDGMFGVRDPAAAVKRAGRSDVIILPPGDYPPLALTKSVCLRASQPGTVRFISPGTEPALTVTGADVMVSGIEVVSGTGGVAILLARGTLIVDDTVVRGGIDARAPGAALHLRQSKVTRANEGVVLGPQSLAELHESAITDCAVGITCQPGSECALYHSRVEGCSSNDAENPGAAIFLDGAKLFCDGVFFGSNGVGVYSTASKVTLVFSHFRANISAAIIAQGNVADGDALTLRSCAIDRQSTPACAQITLQKTSAALLHTVVRRSNAQALAAEGSRLEIRRSALEANDEPTIDLVDCAITARNLSISCDNSAALCVERCQGEIRDAEIIGAPPTLIQNSPALKFTSCNAEDLPVGGSEKTPPTKSPIEMALDSVTRAVAPAQVREEIERLVRQAHASRQRGQSGTSATELRPHCVFTGPLGTAKFRAACVFAEALHAVGAIPGATVVELPLEEAIRLLDENRAAPDILGPDVGAVFVRLPREAAEVSPRELGIGLSRLLRAFGGSHVVILEGEREEARRALRSQPDLEHAFRAIFYFPRLGPPELAALFDTFCQRDGIAIGESAARKLLLALHFFSDRRDKRYGNSQGVAAIYRSAHQRFLERCSRENRYDLELEASDIDLPPDRTLRNALDRSAMFVTACTACDKRNSWLPGLGHPQICLHCDTPYEQGWGIWTGSAFYRKMRETLAVRHAPGSGERRALLPARRG